MAKRQFKAESKRLLDIMIHSIYTHKEIFLRELISNASDAIDRIYYKALTDEHIVFNRDDYAIDIVPDKASRTLTVSDTGIGMTKEELEDNLGIIAKSGSLQFKKENEPKDGFDIIGQFGVGFYSAFMVASKVTVVSRAHGSEQAYKWESAGVDGYAVEPCEKERTGTDIVLTIKESTPEESYEEFLDAYGLKTIVKKYSDFIRYPIRLPMPGSRKKEGAKDEYEQVTEIETVNSMVPLWRKNKNELKPEDYENFYAEKHYGFDKPAKHVHISADGAVRYNAVLFIPSRTPFDFYTKEYEKGLELYANGVMIMQKCAELLPDWFGFVKGMVDSEDLSLNISREMLQHNRQLLLIAKNIKNKIRNELQGMLKNEREKYLDFYKNFGRQLKYGIYSEFGGNREDLEDLLLFYSSTQKQMVTLEEYVSRMKEEQKHIYYATGDTPERIEKLPQAERVAEKGYEILYLTEDVDEFALRVLGKYKEKEFKSISAGDLDIQADEKERDEKEIKAAEPLFEAMKKVLADRVKNVRASKRLRRHPVCLVSEGALSIEMEKVLSAMPHDGEIKADKTLEINMDHEVFRALQRAYENDREKFDRYTNLLYEQALLIEGLPVTNPVDFADNVCRLMV